VIDLRTFTYIDVLQPQLTGFLQTVVPGFNPLEGQAALFVEIAPGLAINTVTDIALKRTSVLPGLQIVERAFGVLEVHSFDQGQIRAAGEAILTEFGLSESDRYKPALRTSERITGLDGHQAMLINRMRHGDMITEGQTLYVMECEPAGYAVSLPTKPRKPRMLTCSRSVPSVRMADSILAVTRLISKKPRRPSACALKA